MYVCLFVYFLSLSSQWHIEKICTYMPHPLFYCEERSLDIGSKIELARLLASLSVISYPACMYTSAWPVDCLEKWEFGVCVFLLLLLLLFLLFCIGAPI